MGSIVPTPHTQRTFIFKQLFIEADTECTKFLPPKEGLATADCFWKPCSWGGLGYFMMKMRLYSSLLSRVGVFEIQVKIFLKKQFLNSLYHLNLCWRPHFPHKVKYVWAPKVSRTTVSRVLENCLLYTSYLSL